MKTIDFSTYYETNRAIHRKLFEIGKTHLGKYCYIKSFDVLSSDVDVIFHNNFRDIHKIFTHEELNSDIETLKHLFQ